MSSPERSERTSSPLATGMRSFASLRMTRDLEVRAAGRRVWYSREFLPLVSVNADTSAEEAPMDTTTLAARRERALGAARPLFYNKPLHIVRGEGVYLFDADGRRYVDMYNNVPCVGHANPHVVEAMARQQAHAQRAQPLPARGHRRLRRAPGGDCTDRRSRASSSAVQAPRPTRWRCAWRGSRPARAASSARTPPITATARRSAR